MNTCGPTAISACTASDHCAFLQKNLLQSCTKLPISSIFWDTDVYVAPSQSKHSKETELWLLFLVLSNTKSLRVWFQELLLIFFPSGLIRCVNTFSGVLPLISVSLLHQMHAKVWTFENQCRVIVIAELQAGGCVLVMKCYGAGVHMHYGGAEAALRVTA